MNGNPVLMDKMTIPQKENNQNFIAYEFLFLFEITSQKKNTVVAPAIQQQIPKHSQGTVAWFINNRVFKIDCIIDNQIASKKHCNGKI
jgi:hypothetical protein